MGASLPLKGMHKQSVSQQLLEITPAYSDRRVAEMLASKCLELTEKPFRYAINHDIRPPKNLACPLRYDWTRKDRVGVEIADKETARRWLVSAALAGYTIYYIGANREVIGFPHSLAVARSRAARHQQPKVDNDDDIPF
jgi:hypothetical protein